MPSRARRHHICKLVLKVLKVRRRTDPRNPLVLRNYVELASPTCLGEDHRRDQVPDAPGYILDTKWLVRLDATARLRRQMRMRVDLEIQSGIPTIVKGHFSANYLKWPFRFPYNGARASHNRPYTIGLPLPDAECTTSIFTLLVDSSGR